MLYTACGRDEMVAPAVALRFMLFPGGTGNAKDQGFTAHDLKAVFKGFVQALRHLDGGSMFGSNHADDMNLMLGLKSLA
jgi:hypothetical protein